MQRVMRRSHVRTVQSGRLCISKQPVAPQLLSLRHPVPFAHLVGVCTVSTIFFTDAKPSLVYSNTVLILIPNLNCNLKATRHRRIEARKPVDLRDVAQFGDYTNAPH